MSNVNQENTNKFRIVKMMVELSSRYQWALIPADADDHNKPEDVEIRFNHSEKKQVMKFAQDNNLEVIPNPEGPIGAITLPNGEVAELVDVVFSQQYGFTVVTVKTPMANQIVMNNKVPTDVLYELPSGEYKTYIICDVWRGELKELLQSYGYCVNDDTSGLSELEQLVSAARAVVDSADNTGCTEDLTVTSDLAIENLDTALKELVTIR